MPGHDTQPAQVFPEWRLWVSATDGHWAKRGALTWAAGRRSRRLQAARP